jgi:hypothetical protein
MPEVVKSYKEFSNNMNSQNEILQDVRIKQKQLLESYKSDFAKH